MKIAYLILAHKNPRLIKKEIEHLSGEDVSFFIHIDAKIAINQFDSIRGPRVFFTDQRIVVRWGEFSVMEAVLILIREALEASPNHDYFVLLGGSDFPLRSGRYIHKFLEMNRGSEFITMVKMPAPGKPLSRINTLRFPSTRPVLRFVFRALAKIGLAQRDHKKYLGNLEPYSGRMWWALSREACRYIIEFIQHHEHITKFFENTHAADEGFIHTILGNSPFKPQIRRHLIYEDWSGPGGRAHPETMNAKHVEFFESQNEVSAQDLHGPGEMLFARKFSDDDLPLVERIAAMIEKKEKFAELNAG